MRTPVKQIPERKGNDRQQQRGDSHATPTGSFPDAIGRNFFSGMIAVGFHIGDVVEQVHRARDQRKKRNPPVFEKRFG
jgi:hypothetical protein